MLSPPTNLFVDQTLLFNKLTLFSSRLFHISAHVFRKHELTPDSAKQLNDSVLHQTSVLVNNAVAIDDPNTPKTPTDSAEEKRKSTKDQTATTEDGKEATEDNPPYPSSFKEVMRCIESGVDIPGVEKITVEPTNDKITKCDVVSMPKKPWER